MICARTISIGLKNYLEEEGIEIPYPTLVTKSFTNSRVEGRDVYLDGRKRLFGLNDVVEMKKQHPCGTNAWKIIRMGADIRINVKDAVIVS